MAVDTQVVDAEQLIVQHLDLWTRAQTAKSTAGRGSNNKIELTGIKKLRELILELAIRGKLVPQDPNDEPASELLTRIAAIKESNIKSRRNKYLPITPEQDDFSKLPQGWSYTTLGQVADIERGITFSASEKSKTPELGRIACLRTTNVQDSIEWDDLLFIREQFVSRPEQFLRKFDIVMSMANSRELVGKVALVEDEPSYPSTFGGFLSVIRTFELMPEYLMVILRSPHIKSQLIDSASQTTNIANISLAKLNPLVIAIPPLKEQERIVIRFQELMTLCDQLEQQSYQSIDAHNQLVDTLLQTLVDSANADELASNWQRLSEHFDTLFTTEYSIDALKQTILQLAVMGKLVKQDPTDEPASELLKRIAKEKEALIKAGKIKKQKPLPPITDDEKPFELPEGWEWCRISNLALLCDYGTSQKSSESEGGIPVISMGQIQAGVVLTENLKRVPHDTPDIDDLFLKNGDLLYNRTNSAELVGKTGVFSGLDDLYTYASYLIRIRLPTDLVSPHYLNAVMNSPKFRELEINPHVKQQCGQANVNGTIMQSMRIPLPPYAEQLSVIAKVEELTALSNQFISRLNMNKKTLITLTTSLLGKVMS